MTDSRRYVAAINKTVHIIHPRSCLFRSDVQHVNGRFVDDQKDCLGCIFTNIGKMYLPKIVNKSVVCSCKTYLQLTLLQADVGTVPILLNPS